MLVSLHVKNMALIQEEEVEFGPGLNILTGETGAGKYIIIGSVNVALGMGNFKEYVPEEAEYALVELVFEEMKCLEEGPTLLGMMIDGNNILYRNVFIKELNAEVKVTTEEVFEAHIEEGSPDDDKFYCYVPAEEFFKLNDIDFEKYVNKNF